MDDDGRMVRSGVWSQVKTFAFMFIIGALVVLGISFLNGNQKTIYVDTSSEGVSMIRDVEMSRQQLTWDNIQLRDDTIYNQDGSCEAEHNGMRVYLPECDVKTISGKNINQEAIFETNRSEGTTYLFIYDDRLQSGALQLWRNYSHSWYEKEYVDNWINNFLVSGVLTYSDLGTPDSRCQIGSVHNSMMYNVTFANSTLNNNTIVYCFSSRTIVNSTAFRISGNNSVLTDVLHTGYKFDYDDITNVVEDITDNVPQQLKKNFTFYKINDVNAGTYKVRWIYTPKGNATHGKFHILSFPTSKGIVQSYQDGDYMYQDPSWSASYNVNLRGYWKMDEGTGTIVKNSINNENGTIAGTTYWTSQGLIGNATIYSGDDYVLTKQTSQVFQAGTTPFTVNTWVNGSAGGDIWVWFAGVPATAGNEGKSAGVFLQSRALVYYGYSTGDLATGVTVPSGRWSMITTVWNGTSIIMYLNGTQVGTAVKSVNIGTTYDLEFGRRYMTSSYGGYYSGLIDEVGYWNRTLSASEINDLYNGGTGIQYSPTIPSVYSMTPSLNSPANAYKSNNTFVTFNWSVNIFNATMNNWTLSVWYANSTLHHVHQLTGLSETTNVSYTHNDTVFNENSYLWGVQTCGLYGNGTYGCEITGNRTFQIHTTAPTITMNNLSNVSTISLPVNVSFNATTSDPELSYCQYVTTDHPVPVNYTCNATTIISFLSGGTKNLTLYGFDTFGNSNSSVFYFNIYDFNVTQSENADPIAEGSLSELYLRINSTSFPITDASASITWNSTNYSPTSKNVIDTNTILFTYSFPVIAGLGNATGKPYSYNWTYNATQLLTRTTPTQTQTVISFGIDDCSVYTVQIANFSLKDEETNQYLYTVNSTATKLEIETLTTSATYPDVTWSYSNSWINRTSVALCVPTGVLNNSNFTIDITAGFEGTSHVREFWYLDSGTLAKNQHPFNSYTSVNVSLMDLLTADSTTFLFEFTDADGLEVPDAIVHVYRKYIGEGVFREVERARQDNNGQTHVHLVEEDVIYYFTISENGEIIYTSDTYNAKCLSSPCEISLSASPSTTNWSVIDNEGGLYAVTSNKNTRIVTTSFELSSIDLVNVSLYELNNGEVNLINSSSLTATAGSIALHVPLAYGNKTYFVAIYNDNEFIRSQWIDMKESGKDYFGTTGAILGGLIVVTIMLMAVTEGVGFIIFTCFALVIVGVMQLVELSWLSLISIICAGGIILFKLVKRRAQA